MEDESLISEGNMDDQSAKEIISVLEKIAEQLTKITNELQMLRQNSDKQTGTQRPREMAL